MNKTLFIALILLSNIKSFSQAPNIEWQKSYGGSLGDSAKCLNQTTDGGYIICGAASSNDGDVSGNHGNSDVFSDFWIIKLNSLGVLQWQKALGGTQLDEAQSIQQTSDGGNIITGKSSSSNGDITENPGGKDFWIVKLNSSGVILWQ